MGVFNASFDLPPVPMSARVARGTVRDLLGAWGAIDLAGDAQLLVDELISNAVEHAGSAVSLQLQLTFSDGWLRVSLADGSSVRPVIHELSNPAERGHGVRIIEAASDRWGAEDYLGGKRVWFELGAKVTDP